MFCQRNLHSLACFGASCRPRSLVVTLVCPQPHKLMHGYGALQLAEHVREHFLRVTDLEIDLGISKQTLRLAPAQESCREDVEQGRLPTLQRQLVVPATARVLGFKYHEVGSSEEAAPCHPSICSTVESVASSVCSQCTTSHIVFKILALSNGEAASTQAVETATGFARVHNLCVLMEDLFSHERHAGQATLSLLHPDRRKESSTWSLSPVSTQTNSRNTSLVACAGCHRLWKP